MYEDKELQEYRDLLKPPDHFEEGFDWKTIVGAIFIGLIIGDFLMAGSWALVGLFTFASYQVLPT